ncbi:hypothetical protein [Enterococcus rivorum]
MKHYTEQFINGVWQEGTSTSLMENYNPLRENSFIAIKRQVSRM